MWKDDIEKKDIKTLIPLALPFVLLLMLSSCKVSGKMVKLPRPKGLVPLGELEKHLDYHDPYDKLPSYYKERRK